MERISSMVQGQEIVCPGPSCVPLISHAATSWIQSLCRLDPAHKLPTSVVLFQISAQECKYKALEEHIPHVCNALFFLSEFPLVVMGNKYIVEIMADKCMLLLGKTNISLPTSRVNSMSNSAKMQHYYLDNITDFHSTY